MTSADQSPILLPIVLDRYDDPDSDPEFGTRRHGRGRTRAVLLPQQYQSLVANPFLALAGAIVWFTFVPRLLQAIVIPMVAIAAVLSVFGLVFLLHFHCLDCGRTGWLFRWKQHACAAVVERQRTGMVRNIRGPTPGWQLAIWVFALLCAAFLVFIAVLGSSIGRFP